MEADELWRPSAERAEATPLARFTERHLPGASYAGLHAWSVAEPGRFWEAAWEHCGIVGERGGVAYEPGDGIRSARFFPQARLNYAENLLQGPGDREALVFQGEDGQLERWTMDKLRSAVARLARALRERGVGRGDVVAGVVPNCPEAIAAMLATQSIGAVWSSCSPDFGAAALVDRLGQVGPKVVFNCSGYSYNGKAIDVRERVAGVCRTLDGLAACVVFPFVVGETGMDAGCEVVDWGSFVAGPEPGEVGYERVGFRDPGFVLFSSGTTGRPKCITHCSGGLLLKHLSELSLHCDVGEGDSLQYITTCGWMMWNWQASALALGARLVLADGSAVHPSPSRLPDLAWGLGTTHFGASSKYLQACEKMGVDPLAEHGGDGPRAVFSTGSALLPASFDYVYRCWGEDVHLASISGGTDICACFVGGVPTEPVRRGRIQCAELGCDMAAFDEGGAEVVGEPGELVCRNAIPSMPTGFWGDADGRRYEAAYFAKYPGVWCHGDWVTFHGDGSLTITGRSDATLNPGGVRIGTAEIYRQVERLPEVADAVAVGHDVDGDQRIVLFVVLAAGEELDGALDRRIRDSIREGATPRHVPHTILAVGDVPRTRSGKVAELAVRDVINGRDVANAGALANPGALREFEGRL